MKKMFLFLFAFVASTSSTFASVENADLGGANICLSCSYVRDRPISVPVGRAPMKTLTVNLMGNNLTIPDSLIGYEMVITSELGDVVFTTIPFSTEVVIPICLSGNYLITFNGEDYCFYGTFSI